jgi:MFS family permease
MKNKSISICSVFLNKHAFFALLMCLMGTFNVTFYEAFISVVLTKKNLDENYVGYVFAVNSVGYLGCCLIFEHLFGNNSRKLLFVLSFIFAGFSMFLFGPSLILNIQDSYWYTVCAFFSLGIV